LNDGTLSGSVAIVAVGVVAGSLLAAIALAIAVLIAPTIAAALRCEASAGVSFFGLYAAIESFPVVMNTLPWSSSCRRRNYQQKGWSPHWTT